jgi:AraC-like DNA-binding protein
MSRSAFAARFRTLTGATPLEYLTDWRMQQAKSMLEDRETPLKQIVASLGYASDAAFRTAFKRRVGQTPGSYRASLRVGGSRRAD